MTQPIPLFQPVILEHDGMYLHIAFSPDGTLLAVVSEGQSTVYGLGDSPQLVQESALAIIWNTTDWTEQARCEGGDPGYRGDFSFHPDSRQFAFASKLWDAATGEVIRPIDNAGWLSFSPDGKMLVGLAANESQDEEEDDEEEYVEPIWEGLLLDTETGETLHRLTKEEDGREILSLLFVQGGERVAATSYTYDTSDRLYFWDTASGTQLPTFDRVGEVRGGSLAVAPSGRYVISAHEEMQLWELEDSPIFQWQRRYTLEGHKYGVLQARFSPDEKLIATVGAEAIPQEGDDSLAFSVRLWDVGSGQVRFVFNITGNCYVSALSPDGRLLATMSAEADSYFKDEVNAYILTLWHVSTGKLLIQRATKSKKTNLLYHYPTNLAFSPNGCLLVVNHLMHAEVWDLPSLFRV